MALCEYRRWCALLTQLVAALGVGASGYASLATSCADDEAVLRATRAVSFAEGERTKTLLIRVAPADWSELDVQTQGSDEIGVSGHWPYRTTGGGQGRAGAPAAESGAAGEAGFAGQRASGGSPEFWAETSISEACESGDCPTEYTVRLERGDPVGAAATELLVTLHVRAYCGHVPSSDMAIQIDDLTGTGG